MKNIFIGFTLLGLLMVSLSACESGKTGKTEKTKAPRVQTADPATLVGKETKLLLDYLNELGDYVNSRTFPSLIKAESVHEGLENNQLILDIRPEEQFASGHIKGAVSIDFSTLPDYFQSEIVPFEFDKIIIVSEDGQASSYATCLLRLMGYGNVYSMRWGMSGWNSDFARDHWFKVIGSAHQEQLVGDVFEKAPPQKLPELNTGKTTGEEILLDRVNTLFAEGADVAHITADEVFANTGNYYIMNYIRRDKYEAGHIPGAIRYKPQATLGIVTAMSTIPQDRESVVYCGTGHNSGFVTAYLRLFGYDAHTLIYGNNAFMYDKMQEERATLSWLPFTEEEIKEYDYVQ
jgi:rhodanese-related sulfurtransferase